MEDSATGSGPTAVSPVGDPHAQLDPGSDTTDERSRRAPPGRAFDLVGAGVALLLITGFLTITAYPAWSLRFAVMIGVIPVGVLLLGRLVRDRSTSALLVVSWITWSAIVSLFHDAPWIRLFGTVSHDASVLLYLGGACCWAIGRSLSEQGRRRLMQGVLLGFAMNALMGLLQVLLAIRTGPFVLAGNRAHGLTSYSVYFGAYMAAACVLLIASSSSRYRPHRLAAVFVFALAGGLSGSRIALLLVVAGASAVAAHRRSQFATAALGLVVAGTLGGSWFAGWRLGEATGDGGTSLQRFGVGGADAGGVGWRVDGWVAGLEAWIDRPITGWGVGNYRQAVDGYLGRALAQEHPRFDAHNIAVEMLVAAGVVGLLLFAGFGLVCAMQARGPLAVTAALIAATWLFQPAGIPTLGLTFLLLGASMPVPSSHDWVATVGHRLVAAAAVAGFLLAALVVAVDYRLAEAIEFPNPDEIEAAARWYPFDPNIADYLAQAHMFEWELTQSAESADEAVAWSERAVERQPDSPYWLDSFARRRIRLGDYDEAADLIDRSLELHPERRESLAILLVLARETDDDELERSTAERLCAISVSICDAVSE